jgi:hypothetical protein
MSADDALSLTATELMRVVGTKEGAKLEGVAEKTFDRTHADDFVWVSPRRRGVRLYRVLGLPRPTLPALVDKPRAITPDRTPSGVALARLGRPRRSKSAQSEGRSTEKEFA